MCDTKQNFELDAVRLCMASGNDTVWSGYRCIADDAVRPGGTRSILSILCGAEIVFMAFLVSRSRCTWIVSNAWNVWRRASSFSNAGSLEAVNFGRHRYVNFPASFPGRYQKPFPTSPMNTIVASSFQRGDEEISRFSIPSHEFRVSFRKQALNFVRKDDVWLLFRPQLEVTHGRESVLSRRAARSSIVSSEKVRGALFDDGHGMLVMHFVRLSGGLVALPFIRPSASHHQSRDVHPSRVHTLNRLLALSTAADSGILARLVTKS
ncbi:hypothetical protein KCU81_g673, partial [Aureobasidium melanogenum]